VARGESPEYGRDGTRRHGHRVSPREHVDDADILVTALQSDEKNLLVSVLAKRLGVDRVIAVVDSPDYVTVFEEIGIDIAINPAP